MTTKPTEKEAAIPIGSGVYSREISIFVNSRFSISRKNFIRREIFDPLCAISGEYTFGRSPPGVGCSVLLYELLEPLHSPSKLHAAPSPPKHITSGQTIPDQYIPALPGRMLLILLSVFPSYFNLFLPVITPGAQQLLHLILLEVIRIFIR